MRGKDSVIVRYLVVVLTIISSSTSGLFAQSYDSISLDTTTFIVQNSNDSITEEQDTIVRPKELMRSQSDSLSMPRMGGGDMLQRDITQRHKTDTLTEAEKRKRIESIRKKNREEFMPDPSKSLWYALMLPGAGQIYNRKYWKLPIVVGGFAGVAYAISWNSARYNEYTIAYLDILDTDPNTNSYVNLVPAGYPDSSTESYLSNSITYLRRYRDMSILIGVAFYAITVIDAYVDAQLADFDVSPDLSIKVRPKLEAVPNSTQPAISCNVGLSF